MSIFEAIGKVPRWQVWLSILVIMLINDIVGDVLKWLGL